MRKLLLFLVAVVLLSGCYWDLDTNNGHSSYKHKKGEFKVSKQDVVLRGEGSVNRERLEEFIKNVEEGSPDEVRVIHYTDEGDPIIDDLKFDGNQITATHDTRWDLYGTPDITEQTCESIKLTDPKGWISFDLLGCSEK